MRFFRSLQLNGLAAAEPKGFWNRPLLAIGNRTLLFQCGRLTHSHGQTFARI